ncbi:quinone-dependent dihydroorotate dehydrogenase [Xanthobacteraceae bacterium Astr-EGSB]|uniref:quinone-dependent dihydroorotate dehydrogenase n=1 Tax=Astrobacterium formosum TaxID=3069710 RepID=UPI0027B19EB1|nr:quinone-dependent dihydroorotate dehydrogenase [Xanthobacteraceae bacterium Astr-EGSB]
MRAYRGIARPLIFTLDAETAHGLVIRCLQGAAFLAPAIGRLFAVDDPLLETTVAGLRFRNPIGLAAGFDKNGAAVPMLAALGFGSVEIGSISRDPSAGNPRPRLFRLPDDHAIVVNYGLPNEGAAAVATRLARMRVSIPLGINIVKTNRPGASCETKDGIIAEYADAAITLAPYADYLMFNLSCPNTEDGGDFFADRGCLDALLQALDGLGLGVPVFLKASPRGGIAAIERLLEAADPHAFVSGFMFNLRPGKPDGLKTPETVWSRMPGAVSGKPSAALADQCIREIYRRMDRRRYAIIGAGGVSSAEDAYAKIRNGASLVQLLTALVYEGPMVVRSIAAGLAELLRRDGFARIGDAVGVDMRG